MDRYYLYENQPAAAFWDAHYLGNGRLGLSVMGKVPLEEVIVNEDTLWSGSERFVERPDFYNQLMKARRLSLAGRVKDANNVINDNMAGRWQETYLPLAKLHIMTGMSDNTRNMRLKTIIERHFDHVEDYSRTLDLETAVETVCWKVNGVFYQMEYFVSHPADCAIIHFTAQNEADAKPLSFAFDLTSDLQFRLRVKKRRVFAVGHRAGSL